MNKRYVRERLLLLSLVVVFVVAVFGGPVDSAEVRSSGPVPAAGPMAVTLAPEQTYIAAAEICTLSVCVASVGDSLGCIECWVSFDTTLVEILDATEGRLFEEAPFQRLFFWIPIAPDTHSVEGCLLGYDTYTTTPGEVARFVFRALRNGICPVKITRLNLFDIDRVLFQPVIDPNAWIVIGPATGIKQGAPATGGILGYPNPFNPSTTVVFTPPSSGTEPGARDVSIGIYTADGRLVRELFNGTTGPDGIRVTWDGKNQAGADATSGVYFAAARTTRETFRTKLVLIR